MNKAKSKGDIIFGVFGRRIVIFIAIIFVSLFAFNQTIKFFSGEKYVEKFFSIKKNNIIETIPLEESNTKEKLKTSILYILLDDILSTKRVNDIKAFEIEFGLSDLKKSFLKNKEFLQNKNRLVGDNFKDFEALLDKFGNFQKINILSKDEIFKAMKIFKVQIGEVNMLLSYEDVKKGKWKINIYRSFLKGVTDNQIKRLFKNEWYVEKIKKGYLLTMKTETGAIKNIYKYENKRYIPLLEYDKSNSSGLERYEAILKTFVERKTYLTNKNRNAFIIQAPKKN